jgi:hypothetical protein
MRRTLGLTVALIVVAGCALVEPEAPVVVSGTLVDGAGQPVPRAEVVLDVLDDRTAQPGQALPTILHAEATSDDSGRFEFRFAPTQELRQFVGANTGFVNFSLSATEPRRQLTWFWNFPREMGLDGWTDGTTPVRLLPIGGS